MSDRDRPPTLTLIEPERMHLLGLMLASLLRRKLDDPVARRHAEALRGQIEILAGKMLLTLRFGPGNIELVRGSLPGRPTLRIGGTLVGLLDSALGRKRVWHFLRGDLFAWGSPFALWHLLSLMRTE